MAIDYHVYCSAHGDQVIAASPRSIVDGGDGYRYLTCECGNMAKIVPGAIRFQGIVGGEYSSQLGREFNSNSEKRAFMEKFPDCRELGADSREYREHRERWKDLSSDRRNGRIIDRKPSHNGRIKSVTPFTVDL
jgi:hypothetical protein